MVKTNLRQITNKEFQEIASELGEFQGAGVQSGHEEQIYGRRCIVQTHIHHYEKGTIITKEYSWPSFCVESGETYLIAVNKN